MISIKPLVKPKKKFSIIHNCLPIRTKCIDCKYFFNNKCKLFTILPYDYVPVIEARSNKSLCGPSAVYFKPK